MNHCILKVLKLLRKHSGKDYPKGGSEMKMENKNRKGVYIGNNNETIQRVFFKRFVKSSIYKTR